MSGYARVGSVEQLRVFRSALVKFAETAMVSLADAEGEMQRVLVWLETEQSTFWTGQIRKRHEAVEKCKDAVRQKKLFKSPSGATQSAVEEEKMLRVAQKRLEEAEEKLKNVRRYVPRLQKEISMYKGGVQRLSTSVSSDIPSAVARLDRMTAAIDAYAALSTTGGGAEDSGALYQQMARALGDMGPAVPDFKPMRNRTAAVDRKAATPGDLRLESWMCGPLHEKERELFSKITSERNVPDAAMKVVYEQGTWEASRIYLERIREPEEGDSGWFLGRADDEPAGEMHSTTVGALLEGRADFREALSLPPGNLVLMDLTEIKAIIDDKGKDIWAPIK